jgi:hypothetical protein
MFQKLLIKYHCKPFRYIDIPDIARQEPGYTYFGGLLLWMHYGEELRTVYLIDVTYGWYRSWDHIEVTLSFTDMELIDPNYDGAECVTASFNTCRLETAPELRELVATSKKAMYHIINTDWDGPAGWFLLTYGSNWTTQIRRFTEDDIINAITQTELVAELIGDVVEGTKTDEELLSFMEQKNISKHVWIIDIDLRYWSNMAEK